MADYLRETANSVQFVFRRRRLANGDERYVRLPVDVVTYDGQEYFETVNQGGPGAVETFSAAHNIATAGTFLVVDTDTFNELHQFRC